MALAESERLLNDVGVWELSSCGWLNEHDMDPNQIGHAMWQTDPPISDDLLAWSLFGQADKPPPSPPSVRQQLLTIAGTDFEGLMTWARLSIGMLLVEVESARDRAFTNDDFLELHSASALIYLSISSDRLLDFIVAAAFGISAKKYQARREKLGLKGRGSYNEVFVDAAKVHSQSAQTDETLNKIAPLSRSVERLRNSRNKLIHGLATEAARRERATLNEPPLQATHDLDWPELQVAIGQSRKVQREKLEQIKMELTNWYQLLIQLSNEAFYIENQLRPRN